LEYQERVQGLPESVSPGGDGLPGCAMLVMLAVRRASHEVGAVPGARRHDVVKPGFQGVLAPWNWAFSTFGPVLPPGRA